MNKLLSNSNKTVIVLYAILLVCTMMIVAGCGTVPVHHVPNFTVSSAKMSDLHGSQPIDLKVGECSSTEVEIGSVGVGKVMGNLSEWTSATVGAIRANLSARGATITSGAPKSLTITMTKAEVKSIPFVGGATAKIVLTATNPEGLNSTFEGSSSSLAPLSAVDGANADAVRKLLSDPAVDAYLRK